MKRLALLIVMLFAAMVAQAAQASTEPAAKLLMITHAYTQSSSPDLSINVDWVDFASMTECTNTVYLLQQKSNVAIAINGVNVKGMQLEDKIGTYGTPMTYIYRCIPAGYTTQY